MLCFCQESGAPPLPTDEPKSAVASLPPPPDDIPLPPGSESPPPLPSSQPFMPQYSGQPQAYTPVSGDDAYSQFAASAAQYAAAQNQYTEYPPASAVTATTTTAASATTVATPAATTAAQYDYSAYPGYGGYDYSQQWAGAAAGWQAYYQQQQQWTAWNQQQWAAGHGLPDLSVPPPGFPSTYGGMMMTSQQTSGANTQLPPISPYMMYWVYNKEKHINRKCEVTTSRVI